MLHRPNSIEPYPSMMTIVHLILALIIGSLLILCSCSEERNNPLDPKNANSQGDAFGLNARFSSRGVELAWKAVDNLGIAAYVIYRGDDSTTAHEIIGVLDKGLASFVDRNVASDSTYIYRVSARDKEGRESSLSRPVTLTVPGLERWLPMGTGVGYIGRKPFVTEFCVYEDRLIVGGDFAGMDDVLSENIISWDGDTWQPLSGIALNSTDYVSALTVFENKLLIGGRFGTASSTIISWQNGTASSFPDTGLSGYIYDLYVHKGTLAAAGKFQYKYGLDWQDSLGCKLWYGIAWDTPMEYFGYADEPDDGFWGFGRALATYGDAFVVAGYQSYYGAGGSIYFRNASYADWLTGIRGNVWAVAIYDGMLVLGGDFTEAEYSVGNNIVAWNGTTWVDLGIGTNGPVQSLTVYRNKLIVGGSFSQAGGISARNIASWDGESWSAMGGSLDWGVYSLAVYDDHLIAGGDFTQSAGVALNGIASWLELVP